MNFLWTTPLPGVLGTILAYGLCVRLQRRARGHALANPVATSIVLLVVLLTLTELTELTKNAGLVLDEERPKLLPYQTFLVFRKP